MRWRRQRGRGVDLHGPVGQSSSRRGKMQPALAARREKRRELRRCRSGAGVLVKERTNDPRPIWPWSNPSGGELLNDRIASRKEPNEGAFGFVAIGRRKGARAAFDLRQKSGQRSLR